MQLKIIKSDPIERKPSKLWTSEENKIALKGQTLTLKCIFGGLPTPDVTWRKTYGSIPEERSTLNLEKQELVITNLQYEDAGVYECRGHNGMIANLFALRRRSH
jgi:neuronal cell adhesion protein